MILLTMAATFLVTLNPERGVSGGVQKVKIEARDSNSARKLIEAQYKGSYRISDVRRLPQKSK